MDCSPEQIHTGQLDAVSNPDEADMPASAGGPDRLHHRLLHADGLDDRVCPETIGEFLDLRDTFITTLCDNIGCAELQRELLARLMAAHRDDAFGAELPGGEHRAEADGAVADDRHRLAGAGIGRHGAEPPGAEHV